MFWKLVLDFAGEIFGKISPTVSKYLIGIVMGLLLGFWIAMKFFTPDVPETRVEYITRVVERLVPQTEIVVEEAERQVEIEYVDRIVEKEVVKYVPVENDPVECNVPIGSVRLLNDARNGRLRESSLSSTPVQPDGEGSAPSVVTRRDLIQSDAAIAIQYNQVATQLNALIDWLEVQQEALEND